MADKVTSVSELKLKTVYYDGDDRTLTVDNPIDDISATQIKELGSFMKETQPILGDKTGAAFVGISTAKVVSQTKTDFDLR